MSVHAGTIVTVAGNSVIDRIQSAGLGDVRVPVETIREVGNELVVDKVTQEPDFTFTMEALDVSTEILATLVGKSSTGTGSAAGAGFADADGTEYRWQDCTRFLNIVSPWKDATTGSAGTVAAAHLIPGFYPRRYRFSAGVTDNATEEVELGGGSFYYGKFPAEEQFENGTGAQVAFATTDPAIRYRKGGATGSTFKTAFGVIVNGVLQTEGVDYTVSGGGAAPGSTATITFTTAPPVGTKNVRFAYFTSTAKSYPQAVHASTVIKPGAVRGRHICVKLGSAATRVGNVQSFNLEATVDGEVEREFCNEDQVGFTVNGLDCNGTMTVRSRDYLAFFNTLRLMTGVDTDSEVVGWLNENDIPLIVEIQNPKNPAQILKTYYVSDAKFQVPGTPARVNTPTDFQIQWESITGTFSAFKGAKP